MIGIRHIKKTISFKLFDIFIQPVTAPSKKPDMSMDTLSMDTLSMDPLSMDPLSMDTLSMDPLTRV
jgi:hypothetical protein